MIKLFKKSAFRYLNIVDIFVPVSLLVIFIFLIYRLDLYYSFRHVYGELGFITAWDFLSLSFSSDTYAVAISMVIIVPVLMVFSFRRWAVNTAASTCLILLSLYLLLSLEFFKVYEISFNPGLLDNEILSGWKDLLNSVFHELTAGFYIKGFLAIALFSPPLIAIMYGRFRFIHILKSHRDTSLEKLFLYYPPVLITLFILFPVFTGSGNTGDLILEEMRIRKGEKLVLNIRDLSKNPFGALFFHDKAGNKFSSKVDTEQAKMENFSFGLDTTSMFSSRVHEKKNQVKRGKKYNIILYFFESTSYRYLNEKVNGRYVTPNWRKLMNNAYISENHYTNFPLSANALFTVLTSSYDEYSKDLVIQKYPKINIKTIYEILKDNGYRTCLIHTGSLLYAGQKKFLENRKIDRIVEYRDLAGNSRFNKIVGYGIDERAMIKPGVDFIREDTSTPFLISFLPLNPHHPYAIPDSSFRITGNVPSNSDPKQRRWMNYLNSLHYSDHAMGELVNELEKNNLMENTLFILFADHGQAFYQHRENFNHRHFLYEENVHVPFLIYNKSIFRKPVYYGGISRHVDILPTVLDALGINNSGNMEGVSLFSSHRQQYALLHTSWNHEFFGIRDSNWKYIFRVADGFEELYDLKSDILETKNLASKFKNRVTISRHLVSKARLYNYKYFKKLTVSHQQ